MGLRLMYWEAFVALNDTGYGMIPRDALMIASATTRDLDLVEGIEDGP